MSFLSLPLATIKLNGVDQPLSPITGTDLNDKLTVDGESFDNILATLAKGKDLVTITNTGAATPGDDFNDITVNGGDGDDVITSTDGLLTLTGKLNGVAGNDQISITNALGATVQGGKDSDTITVGSATDLDVAGSRATSDVFDSSILGGDGADTVSILQFADLIDTTVVGGGGHDVMSIDGDHTGISDIIAATDSDGNVVYSADSFIKGGDGRDDITLADGATFSSTLISGNANADVISAGTDGRGVLETSGSIVSGGAGDDVVEVALGGAMTVKGGSGNDILRVGSGQTVEGGKGVDIFSIEAEGGVTITDYNNKKELNPDGESENCYCSDAIQIDGNKIHYTSKAYEPTVAVNTTLSSYTGVIKVKAIADAVTDNAFCEVPYGGIKIESLNATAVAYGFATEAASRNALTGSNNADYVIKYPESGFITGTPNVKQGSRSSFVVPNGMNNLTGQLGSAPIGNFGTLTKRLDSVPNTPLQTELKGIGFGFASAEGVIVQQNSAVFVNNIVATTYVAFQEGQFSFLGLSKRCETSAKVEQQLVFNDVSNATIKNHSAIYGVAKETATKELYTIGLGTDLFQEVTVGTAYMKVKKNIEDKTYLITDKTENGGVLQNTVVGTANAVLTLNAEFKFAIVTKDVTSSNPLIGLAANPSGTANAKYGQWVTVTGGFNSNNAQWVAAKSLQVSASLARTQNVGVFSEVFETAQKRDSRYVAISVSDNGFNSIVASLPQFIERRTFGPTVINITTCPEFPSPDSLGAKQGNKHGDVVLSNSSKSLIWTGDNAAAQIADVLNAQNGGVKGNTANGGTYNAYFSSNLPKNCNSSTSCDGGTYVAKIDSKSNLTKNALTASTLNKLNFSGGFFSGSDWNTTVLANQEGTTVSGNAMADMGDGLSASQSNAQGAPFRVLFFDTKGEDNGLYLYSGLADYSNGVLTGISNTGGTVSSAMGGKQTIVKVTGGKGHEISLSDITLV